MKIWQLQEAKAHLSEVVRNALNQEPQMITLHGMPAVTVISNEMLAKLRDDEPSFIEFMRKSPLMGIDIDISRSDSFTREDDL